jgi:N-acetylglucosaminyldiphosphoundecaprenol N-acetyl-beta-D-mannosaminyltransferase
MTNGLINTNISADEYPLRTVDNSKYPAINIFNTRIHNISLDDLIEYIRLSLNDNKKRIISYVNIYALNLAYELEWFRNFINRSDIAYCDGFGLILASKIFGTPLRYRFTPPDWIYLLLDKLDCNPCRFFLLGSKPEVVKTAAEKIISYKPDIMVRFYHGYFEKERQSMENEAVLSLIHDFKPQILLVGLGMPLQEKWISENFDDIQADVILPVGALFDYMSGNVKRAPLWMTNHGLEWLGRLYYEPKRLWKRYLIGIPLFYLRVYQQRLISTK